MYHIRGVIPSSGEDLRDWMCVEKVIAHGTLALFEHDINHLLWLSFVFASILHRIILGPSNTMKDKRNM